MFGGYGDGEDDGGECDGDGDGESDGDGVLGEWECERDGFGDNIGDERLGLECFERCNEYCDNFIAQLALEHLLHHPVYRQLWPPPFQRELLHQPDPPHRHPQHLPPHPRARLLPLLLS